MIVDRNMWRNRDVKFVLEDFLPFATRKCRYSENDIANLTNIERVKQNNVGTRQF